MPRESVAGASGHGPQGMNTITIENTRTGQQWTWEDEPAESVVELLAWLDENPQYVLVDSE